MYKSVAIKRFSSSTKNLFVMGFNSPRINPVR